MHSGIIFFEDGSMAMFGEINTVRNIIRTANVELQRLHDQERAAILNSVAPHELKQLIEKMKHDNNSNI